MHKSAGNSCTVEIKINAWSPYDGNRTQSGGWRKAFINGGITKIEIEIKNLCYSQKDLKISCKCGYQDQ